MTLDDLIEMIDAALKDKQFLVSYRLLQDGWFNSYVREEFLHFLKEVQNSEPPEYNEVGK